MVIVTVEWDGGDGLVVHGLGQHRCARAHIDGKAVTLYGESGEALLIVVGGIVLLDARPEARRRVTVGDPKWTAVCPPEHLPTSSEGLRRTLAALGSPVGSLHPEELAGDEG